MQDGKMRLKPGRHAGLPRTAEVVGFEDHSREELDIWVDEALRQQRCQELNRNMRTVVRRYLETMTGLSRAQVRRLMACYQRHEAVKPKPYRRHRFAQRYTRDDIAFAGSCRRIRHPGHAMVDELAAVIRVKGDNPERELLQDGV